MLSCTFPGGGHLCTTLTTPVVISDLNFIYLSAQTFQYSDGRGTNCTNTTNSPATNFFAETYALGSRCVEQGQQWTWSTVTQTATPTTYGAGCYQVSSVRKLEVDIDVRHDVVCFLCSIIVELVVWSSTYFARASPVHVRVRR